MCYDFSPSEALLTIYTSHDNRDMDSAKQFLRERFCSVPVTIMEKYMAAEAKLLSIHSIADLKMRAEHQSSYSTLHDEQFRERAALRSSFAEHLDSNTPCAHSQPIHWIRSILQATVSTFLSPDGGMGVANNKHVIVIITLLTAFCIAWMLTKYVILHIVNLAFFIIV